jgi:HEPN domain-containing protein
LEEIKNIDKIINHWIESSDEDFKTMHDLFEQKTYHWSLFIGHICIEKLLKGVYVKKFRKHAPFTHNLVRLTELCELDVDQEKLYLLDKITTFNLNTRYDDYKKEFYNQCNLEFTTSWVNNISTIRIWIKKLF